MPKWCIELEKKLEDAHNDLAIVQEQMTELGKIRAEMDKQIRDKDMKALTMSTDLAHANRQVAELTRQVGQARLLENPTQHLTT